MKASTKEIAFDQSSRDVLQVDIDKIVDVVGLTLVPRRSVLFSEILFFSFSSFFVLVLMFFFSCLKGGMLFWMNIVVPK